MAAKFILILCAQALFIQSISAQCYGSAYPLGLGYEGFGIGVPRGSFPAAALAASNGPGLALTSVSPIAPVGVTLSSDNAIEGSLAITGSLPFLAAVALEGALPTAGAGAISYGCGNGDVGILAEDIAGAPFGFAASPLDYAGGPLGYGTGFLGYDTGPLGYGVGPFGYGALEGAYGTYGYGARF